MSEEHAAHQESAGAQAIPAAQVNAAGCHWDVAKAQGTSPPRESDGAQQGHVDPAPHQSLGKCTSDSVPGAGGAMGSYLRDAWLCGKSVAGGRE